MLENVINVAYPNTLKLFQLFIKMQRSKTLQYISREYINFIKRKTFGSDLILIENKVQPLSNGE